jgi:hypothetical protein
MGMDPLLPPRSQGHRPGLRQLLTVFGLLIMLGSSAPALGEEPLTWRHGFDRGWEEEAPGITEARDLRLLGELDRARAALVAARGRGAPKQLVALELAFLEAASDDPVRLDDRRRERTDRWLAVVSLGDGAGARTEWTALARLEAARVLAADLFHRWERGGPGWDAGRASEARALLEAVRGSGVPHLARDARRLCIALALSDPGPAGETAAVVALLDGPVSEAVADRLARPGRSLPDLLDLLDLAVAEGEIHLEQAASEALLRGARLLIGEPIHPNVERRLREHMDAGRPELGAALGSLLIGEAFDRVGEGGPALQERLAGADEPRLRVALSQAWMVTALGRADGGDLDGARDALSQARDAYVGEREPGGAADAFFGVDAAYQLKRTGHIRLAREVFGELVDGPHRQRALMEIGYASLTLAGRGAQRLRNRRLARDSFIAALEGGDVEMSALAAAELQASFPRAYRRL